MESFYLTVGLADGFSYSWTHNMESALGQRVGNLEELLDLIHPTWQEMHKVYIRATLKLIAFKRNGPLNDEIVFTTDIPLKVASGGYRWFKQTTTIGAVTEEGNLLSYLNQYYVLGSFSSLIPDSPVITLRGKPGRRINQAFQQYVNALLPEVLAKNFPSTARTIINNYREQARWNGEAWEFPVKAQMADIIGMKPEALDRAISRLLKKARTAFPGHAANNIANFINLLNTLFPLSLIEADSK